MSNPARILRTCAQVAAAAVLFLSPAVAHANGAVLVPASVAEPTTLDAEVAVAVTPFGTTRWTRLTVGGSQRVLWLVPARPGAALDWATDGWLSALEDATSPRVGPPSAAPPCNMPVAAERVAPWTITGTKQFPKAVLVHAGESDARSHVAARGFAISAAVSAKISEVYARGYALVSLELEPGAAVISSPTLRIEDDGAPVVPLALTGSTQTPVRVTAVVIGEGPATLPGGRELDTGALMWGRNSSNYASARAGALVAGGGAIWMREAAAHEVLFDGLAVPRGAPIEPVSTGYFRNATGQAQPACDSAARTAGSAAGTVGRACAGGALARVPGGAACVPSDGTIEPGSFVCGAGLDDLALALAGSAPSRTFVTRITGLVPQNGLGIDTVIASSSTSHSPVVFARSFEPCPVSVTPPPGSSGSFPSPSPSPKPAGDGDRPHHYERTSSGCSGSATTVVYEDTGEEEPVSSEGCGSTSTGTSTSTGDGDDCGGDTSSSSSSSSSSGWDDSDDDSDDSSDDSSGWDDDDSSSSSSSSSDSCDCGKSATSTSSSSSGDDTSEATPQSVRIGGEGDAGAESGAKHGTKKKHKKHHKKSSSTTTRGPSPVSRYALLFVALLLPLRRRLRLKKL